MTGRGSNQYRSKGAQVPLPRRDLPRVDPGSANQAAWAFLPSRAAWERSGVNDLDTYSDWVSAGGTPEDAAEWDLLADYSVGLPMGGAGDRLIFTALIFDDAGLDASQFVERDPETIRRRLVDHARRCWSNAMQGEPPPYGPLAAARYYATSSAPTVEFLCHNVTDQVADSETVTVMTITDRAEPTTSIHATEEAARSALIDMVLTNWSDETDDPTSDDIDETIDDYFNEIPESSWAISTLRWGARGRAPGI